MQNQHYTIKQSLVISYEDNHWASGGRISFEQMGYEPLLCVDKDCIQKGRSYNPAILNLDVKAILSKT